MKTKAPPRLESAILAGALWLAPCMAHGLAAAESDSLQMSVRELMRLDADLALKHLKNRIRKENLGKEAVEAGAGLANSGAPRLVAIYGVGPNLLAEVMIGLRPYIYLRGKALAVGAKAGPSEYLLRGISGTCVHLERQQEAHTLCLHPGLWTARQ
ncbi:hypothetical protein V0R37_19135 [Pollutimonas sp. H1-120]|uniref:hypothetical protein n=1 Tax=Pollutimonas sp. H1-120 TaxID=3148824 RepID=UPI003B52C47A